MLTTHTVIQTTRRNCFSSPFFLEDGDDGEKSDIVSSSSACAFPEFLSSAHKNAKRKRKTKTSSSRRLVIAR